MLNSMKAAFVLSSAVALSIAPAADEAYAQGAIPIDHSAHHAAMAEVQSGAVPTLPGQDAFGAIQEIVHLLEADPNTDWSKVNIDTLREHLIDMSEVALRAKAVATPVDGGARFDITGEGRTLTAIQHMVPAHAHEMNGKNGWSTKTEPKSDGVLLTVTSADPKQTVRIRAMGFMGFMAQGSHHQLHHLAMARGEFTH